MYKSCKLGMMPQKATKPKNCKKNMFKKKSARFTGSPKKALGFPKNVRSNMCTLYSARKVVQVYICVHFLWGVESGTHIIHRRYLFIVMLLTFSWTRFWDPPGKLKSPMPERTPSTSWESQICGNKKCCRMLQECRRLIRKKYHVLMW